MNVSLVGETRVYMDALAQALGPEPELNVISTVSVWHDLLRVEASDPHVVLLDATSSTSLAQVRSILEARPTLLLVAVGVRGEELSIIRFAEAGVSGFVLNSESIDHLIAVIRSLVRGEALCSPRLVATLLRRVATLAAVGHEPFGTHLTRRETEVVGLVCEGLSNKEIALRLGIEAHTAKNHVHNVLKKLRARRRSEIPARVRAGIMGLNAALPILADLLPSP